MTIQTQWSGTPHLTHVYPIAIGPKSGDHREVQRIILNNIKEMEEAESVEFFNGATGTIQKFATHMLCFIQDQPERRNFTGLLSGGKAFHSRWGWSFNVASCYEKLLPCDDCRKTLSETSYEEVWQPLESCASCYNFWQNPDIMSCPIAEGPNGNEDRGQHKCLQLSFKILKEAVTRCHEKIVSHEWSKQSAKAYLSGYCVNTQFQEEITNCALNVAKIETAVNANDPDVVEAAQKLREGEPENYQKWVPPAIWDTELDLQQFTEPGMHLLFLGIVKNSLLDIQEWLALRNKYSTMQRKLEGLTSQVEGLRLSWCKVVIYRGEKLGGWFSENFLGFARVLPWMYATLKNVSTDAPFEPPDRPIGKWTVAQCKGFLRSRHLSRDGRVKELRERVRANEHLPPAPPVGGPPEPALNMILALWVMVSFLMGLREVDNQAVNKAAHLIRIFLSARAEFDRHCMTSSNANSDDNLPLWVTQYNYQCLVNIPGQMEKLGPIRNRWEGGKRGEGFLRSVKPVINATRPNWQRHVLSNLVRQKTLANLSNWENNNDKDRRMAPQVDLQEIQSNDDFPEHANNADTEDNPSTSTREDGDKQWHDPQTFFRYKSIAGCLRDASELSKPLSIVCCDDGSDNSAVKLYLAYKYQGETMLFELRIAHQSAPRFHCGLWYHHFDSKHDEALEEYVEDPSLRMTDVLVLSYGLLLPLSEAVGGGNDDGVNHMMPVQGYYALVSSDWKVLNATGGLVQPGAYLLPLSRSEAWHTS